MILVIEVVEYRHVYAPRETSTQRLGIRPADKGRTDPRSDVATLSAVVVLHVHAFVLGLQSHHRQHRIHQKRTSPVVVAVDIEALGIIPHIGSSDSTNQLIGNIQTYHGREVHVGHRTKTQSETSAQTQTIQDGGRYLR